MSEAPQEASGDANAAERQPTWLLAAAGMLGASAIGAGAFGAHALRGLLDPPLLAAFHTGARYHLVHAVVVLALALARQAGWRGGRVAAGCMIAGIVLFSGSLYILALSGQRYWGIVTPVGGLVLIVGWLTLTAAAFRSRTPG